ncbi:universal stress protein [Salegentibacter chungangensis]|uniref:Universal stress protein n=1 Tax=Salegentibacter chungangensis TaxID=1335724 RepID=A0ABW3NVB9_9FLAO
MRKIVIPTDFSVNAFNAFKYAVDLFKYEKSEFFVVHAYADEVYDQEVILSRELMEELKAKTLERTNKELQLLLDKIKEYSPNPRHSFKAISTFGSLVDGVNHLINKENADVAIMGTRGKTNDRSISFGSNTLQVLKYVQCPVLSIPEDFEYKRPEKMLFPSNFLIPYQKRELKLVAELAKSYRSEIHMIYISNFPADSYRQKDNQIILKEQFHESDFYFHCVDEGDKLEIIKKFIKDLEIDLLIMVNSRHTYLESILYQSTIDKIGLHPKIPFLVLQNYNRECT